MKNKKAQMDYAILKGIALAIVVLSGFLFYETTQLITPEGDIIKCKWDCSRTEWGACDNGYSYRNVDLCIPKPIECLDSGQKPPNIKICD